MPRFRYLLSVCLTCLSQSSQAECVRPEVSPYTEQEYYASAFELEGDKLKNALGRIIGNHHRQELECLPGIIGSDSVDGPQEFHYLWPESIGFPDDMQDAYTDAHNLRHSILSPELVDRMPQQNVPPGVRGDFARTLFYMAVRYQGNDASLTPDLELVVGKPEPETPHLGGLCLLLDWHEADPVSALERNRNDRIYQWQGNRNPFIDRPEFAADIWSNACLGFAERKAEIQSIVQRLEEIELEVKDLKRRLREMMSENGRE